MCNYTNSNVFILPVFILQMNIYDHLKIIHKMFNIMLKVEEKALVLLN